LWFYLKRLIFSYDNDRCCPKPFVTFSDPVQNTLGQSVADCFLTTNQEISMSISRNALNALIAGAFAATMASATHQAFAAGTPAQEKCYGIAKAGKNDCASMAKTHTCAGQAKMDGAGGDFLVLPEGLCTKIVGGSMKMTDAAGMMQKGMDKSMDDK
jgi:uncharacterized membrane protein